MPIQSPSSRQLNPDVSARQFERVLDIAARSAIVLIAMIAFAMAMQAGRVVLMPVTLAIIVGLMFGPVADWFERRNIPPALSGGLVVVLFLTLIAGGIFVFAVPLSEWVDRWPMIWEKLRGELVNWRAPLEALDSLQEQLNSALGTAGNSPMAVTVEGRNPLTDIALQAPGLLAEIVVFLVSLYLYLATRDGIRASILSICVSRRIRWRTAHVFHDVEARVSRFLLAVTFLNICVGITLFLVTWSLGLPSPLLWGAMAFVLNFIPYVGQAVMIVVLLGIGIGTQTDMAMMLAPTFAYLAITFVEGQIAFPQLVGRAVTLNPFLIFLAITFWIWAWGPFGALAAVPSLLIVQSFLTNILPSKPVMPRQRVRRTANMTERDLILANAAAAIRERAEAAGSAPAEGRTEGGTEPIAKDSDADAAPPKPVRRSRGKAATL